MSTSKAEVIAPEKLKDVLITRTAIRTLKPESVVEKVISHQFKGARDAVKVHAQVEISGFGKFLLSQPKLIKKILRHEQLLEACKEAQGHATTERRRSSLQQKINVLTDDLTFLRSKRKV